MSDNEGKIKSSIKRITTLRKQDGSTIYPRTVMDAIADKEGKTLTSIISSITSKNQNNNTLIENTNERIDSVEDFIEEVKEAKVDKVEGKGLSTNDLTDALKAKLDNLPNKEGLSTLLDTKVDKESLPILLDEKVNKEEGKALSTNDFTDESKDRLWNNIYSKIEIRDFLDEKVDKIEGKGLSTNDLTNELKAKILSNENRLDTADDDLVKDIICDDNKIAFYSRNNNIISEIEFLTEEEMETFIKNLDD